MKGLSYGRIKFIDFHSTIKKRSVAKCNLYLALVFDEVKFDPDVAHCAA